MQVPGGSFWGRSSWEEKTTAPLLFRVVVCLIVGYAALRGLYFAKAQYANLAPFEYWHILLLSYSRLLLGYFLLLGLFPRIAASLLLLLSMDRLGVGVVQNGFEAALGRWGQYLQYLWEEEILSDHSSFPEMVTGLLEFAGFFQFALLGFLLWKGVGRATLGRRVSDETMMNLLPGILFVLVLTPLSLFARSYVDEKLLDQGRYQLPAQPGAEGDTEGEGENSCRYANDGTCDEPNFCAPGTDTSDCATTRPAENGPDSCQHASDGKCDEPEDCAAGTDTSDCASPPPLSPDSCQYANDGVCDEPHACATGTDTSDCAAAQPVGPGEDSCLFANDGVCDEPGVCDAGTDTSDCLK